MKDSKTIDRMKTVGIIPVAIIHNEEDAIPVVRALEDGGIDCIEITFRTGAAGKIIKCITKEYPHILVGAGTVTKIEQAKEAIQSGAQFIVSPGLNCKIVEYVLSKGIIIIPGVMTPTEIETAMGYGLVYLKYFPAEACGGLKMLRALCAPYSEIRFMPTGGISSDNLGEYLRYDKVFACGGSWLIKDKWLKNKDYINITNEAKKAVNIVKLARKH